MLANRSDVEPRLKQLVADDNQRARIEALLEEASALVVAYLGHQPNPVPDTVRLVVARMVARVVDAPSDVNGVESTSMSAGPYSTSRNFSAGATSGSPWLTKADKTMLAQFRKRRRSIMSLTLR